MILFVHERLESRGPVACGACGRVRTGQSHTYRVPGSRLRFCGPCRARRPGECQAAAEADERVQFAGLRALAGEEGLEAGVVGS